MNRRLVIPEVALATIEAILIGAGMAVVVISDLDNWDVTVAKGCFGVAFLLLCVQVVLFLARRRGLIMYFIAFFACGTFGVIGLGAFNYVNHRRDRKAAQENQSNQMVKPDPVSPPISEIVKPSPSPTPQLVEGHKRKASTRDDTEEILHGRKKGPAVK